jgi:hypothetical protein
MASNWGLGHECMDVVFTTPEGLMFDRCTAGELTRAHATLERMRGAFDKYRELVFARIEPDLRSSDAPLKNAAAAVARVDDLLIERADRLVAAVLDRADLDDETRTQVCNALAKLSTRAAVEALAQKAVDRPAAANALGRCTPEAADLYILPHVASDDVRMRLIAYRAVVEICGIRDAKPDRFWSGPDEAAKRREIERVRRLVRDDAKRWSERNEYR